jgi:hypothetical protein
MLIPSVGKGEWNYLYEDLAFNVKMLFLGKYCKNCKFLRPGGGASLCQARNRVLMDLKETVCKLYETRIN